MLRIVGSIIKLKIKKTNNFTHKISRNKQFAVLLNFISVYMNYSIKINYTQSD